MYIDVTGDIDGAGYWYRITTTAAGQISWEYTFESNHVNSDADFKAFAKIGTDGRRQWYETDFGVRFWHRGRTVVLNLPYAYRQNVEGLCANWNSVKEDDLSKVSNYVILVS